MMKNLGIGLIDWVHANLEVSSLHYLINFVDASSDKIGKRKKKKPKQLAFHIGLLPRVIMLKYFAGSGISLQFRISYFLPEMHEQGIMAVVCSVSKVSCT